MAQTLPIVKVWWVDAHSHGLGWLDESDFMAWLAEPGIMVSVGLLLHKDKKWIALAMSTGFDAIADSLKIPTATVKRIEHLGTVTAKDKIGPRPGGKKRCHQSSAQISSQSARPSRSTSKASRSSSGSAPSNSIKGKMGRSATRC